MLIVRLIKKRVKIQIVSIKVKKRVIIIDFIDIKGQANRQYIDKYEDLIIQMKWISFFKNIEYYNLFKRRQII